MISGRCRKCGTWLVRHPDEPADKPVWCKDCWWRTSWLEMSAVVREWERKQQEQEVTRA